MPVLDEGCKHSPNALSLPVLDEVCKNNPTPTHMPILVLAGLQSRKTTTKLK